MGRSLYAGLVAEEKQVIEADVNIARQHFDTSYKTSAATSFDAAAGLAALTKHGIGLVTGRIVPNQSVWRKGGGCGAVVGHSTPLRGIERPTTAFGHLGDCQIYPGRSCWTGRTGVGDH